MPVERHSVAGALLLAPFLFAGGYVVAYLGLVKHEAEPAYRWGRQIAVKTFQPVHEVDRQIRPAYWDDAQTIPSPWYDAGDVQYFAPGPEFKLSHEAAAMREYKTAE
jgi:hypothetical protein